MDYSKLLRKAGRFSVELITIGLIGFLIFVFLIMTWETKYLNRYKYVQGQDIKREIVDRDLNEEINPGVKEKIREEARKRAAWRKCLNRKEVGIIEAPFVWIFKILGVGKEKPEKKLSRPWTEINIEILTPTLVKLKEKADEENFDVEIYINRVLRDHVKE